MSEKQSTQHRGWGIANLAILAMDVIGLVLMAIIVVKYKQLLIDLFNRLGGPLPVLTKFQMSVPLIADLLFFAILLSTLVLKEKFISSKPTRFALNLFVAVGLGYVFINLSTMVIPLLQILEMFWLE